MAQNYREYYIEKDCREVAMLNISKPIRAMPILKSKKQGHHTGAWFTTDGAPDLDPIGVHDLGSLVLWACLLYTSPSPRDATLSRMPSSA